MEKIIKMVSSTSKGIILTSEDCTINNLEVGDIVEIQIKKIRKTGESPQGTKETGKTSQSKQKREDRKR